MISLAARRRLSRQEQGVRLEYTREKLWCHYTKVSAAEDNYGEMDRKQTNTSKEVQVLKKKNCLNKKGLEQESSAKNRIKDTIY